MNGIEWVIEAFGCSSQALRDRAALDNLFLRMIAEMSLRPVGATQWHQFPHVDRNVWTFYWALAEGSPAQNRQFLLDKDWSYWKEAILRDLERVHRNIRQCVSRMDIMRMGHAMVRPAVGSVFSEERRHTKTFHNRVFFSNSDLSGISIFEEAQYHGVEAAQKVLARLGGKL